MFGFRKRRAVQQFGKQIFVMQSDQILCLFGQIAFHVVPDPGHQNTHGGTGQKAGQKFQFPDDYLYDGFVSTARSYARGDAPALREFVASYREDVENTYDCPIGRELIQRFG